MLERSVPVYIIWARTLHLITAELKVKRFWNSQVMWTLLYTTYIVSEWTDFFFKPTVYDVMVPNRYNKKPILIILPLSFYYMAYTFCFPNHCYFFFHSYTFVRFMWGPLKNFLVDISRKKVFFLIHEFLSVSAQVNNVYPFSYLVTGTYFV